MGDHSAEGPPAATRTPGGIPIFDNAEANKNIVRQGLDFYRAWRRQQMPRSEVTQDQVVAGGKADVIVGPKGRQRREIDSLIVARADVVKMARDRSGTGQPRSDQDTIIDRAVEAMVADKKLGEKVYTAEDMSVINAVIYDTLLNQTAAVARMIIEQPGRLDDLRKRYPFIRKLSTVSRPQLEAMAARYRSDLAELYGTATSNPDKIARDIENLDNLRLKLIESYFPFRRGGIKSVAERIQGFREPIDDYGGHRSPMFDLIETSIHPRSFQEKSGHIYQDLIVEKFVGHPGQRDGLLQQAFPGMTPEEVWRQHPDRYWALLEQANKVALSDAAPEMAKKSLEKKQIKEGDNIARIDTFITRFNSRELPFGEKKIENTEITTLESSVSTSRATIKTKNDEIVQVDEGVNTATREQRAAAQKALILRNQIANFGALLANLPPAAGVVVGDPPEIAQAKRTTQDTKIKEFNTKISELTTQRAEQVGIVADKAELLRQLNLPDQVAARDQRKRALASDIRVLRRQLRADQTELRTKRADWERQQGILKGELTVEQQIQKAGLEKLKDISVNQFSTIMAKFFDINRYPECSRDLLTSTRRVNGRVEGVAAQQQVILNTFSGSVEDKFLYDAANDTQRFADLFDEYTIGRSVIELLHLQMPVNVNVVPAVGVARAAAVAPITNGMVAIDARVREIRNLLRTPAIVAVPAQVTALRDELREIGSQVVIQVLPNLQRSNYDMAELTQYMINKRVRLSAATGDPFALESDFQAPEELHRFDPEAVLTAGLGVVRRREIDPANNCVVEWEGETPNTFAGNNLPINTRVELRVAPDNGNRRYNFLVRADQELVTALQGVAVANVPPEIINAIYAGGIINPSRIRNQWIRIFGEDIGARPAIDIDRLYGANANVDNIANLDRLYAPALAANILHMKPQERKGFLGGLEDVVIPAGGGVPARTITMDNDGNFWIYPAANPANRRELKGVLFEDIRNDMQIVNAQRLDPDEMIMMNDLLLRDVLNALGQSVFNSLSGR